jgi:hypothetical protein
MQIPPSKDKSEATGGGKKLGADSSQAGASALLGRFDIVGAEVGSRFFEGAQLAFKVGDHAATVGASPDARRRFEDLQLAPHSVDGFGQLLAEGFF